MRFVRHQSGKLFARPTAPIFGKRFNGERGLEVAIVDPAGIFGPYSYYGNAELIDMLLKGAMLLPAGGKHRASMVHSQDVIGMCDYLMHYPELPKGKDPQAISYLAADTTPLSGRELLEMIWQEIRQFAFMPVALRIFKSSGSAVKTRQA